MNRSISLGVSAADLCYRRVVFALDFVDLLAAPCCCKWMVWGVKCVCIICVGCASWVCVNFWQFNCNFNASTWCLSCAQLVVRQLIEMRSICSAWRRRWQRLWELLVPPARQLDSCVTLQAIFLDLKRLQSGETAIAFVLHYSRCRRVWQLNERCKC